jgi:predicted nuclease of predicted toxin-antitoxin system
MKLLFDQNLSFKLVPQLHDLFPNSAQVRSLGLDRADDNRIWAYARQNDYVLVTQDADYSNLSNLRGYPPKLIWLRCGNRPTREIEALLRGNHSDIIKFLSESSVGCLEIS